MINFLKGQMIVTPSGVGMVEYAGPRKIRVKFGAEGPVQSFWRNTALRHASTKEIKAAGLHGVGYTPSKVATPTICLPNGKYVTAGAYAKAWRLLKLDHAVSLFNGKDQPFAGFFDYPASPIAILYEMRKGLADRINRRDPVYGKGRRWDTDYQAALARDAKMLRYFRAYGGQGLPTQRLETEYFIKRYKDQLLKAIIRGDIK